MMRLPTQLPWRDFERVLRHLGYSLHKAGPGAARAFFNPQREPKIVVFHEPHSPATIATGTLRQNIRKLGLSRDEFLKLLSEL